MGGGSTVKNDGQSAWKKALITGVAVQGEMLTGGLFMENVKMEKQRTSQPYPTIMKRILGQGIKGFEAGYWPWGFVLGMAKGTVLGGSRAFLLNNFQQNGMTKKNADLASGFGAGACQGVFMSPILLARTRVNQSLAERTAAALASGTKLKTTFAEEMAFSQRVIFDGIKKDGMGTLVKGMPQMIVKRAGDWGTRFIFIGMCTNFLQGRQVDKLNNFQQLGANFVGGAMSCAVTMPIDRMMPIIQQAGASGEGVMPFIKRKVAEEGVSTLQRGFVMRSIHTGWHTVFAIFIADKIYAALS